MKARSMKKKNKQTQGKEEQERGRYSSRHQKSLLLFFVYIYMAKIERFPAGNPDRAVKSILPFLRPPHNVC